MTAISENEVFATIGPDGFRRLVASFYRQVPNDDILGPMYPPEDMAGAEDRLRGFLEYRFGGPETYIVERGHPALRMRHAPYRLNPDARNRWVQLMTTALDEAQFPAAADEILRRFFAHTATFLINTFD